jgi:hypothetical protein
VITGATKWNFTIGNDRLVYVIKNNSEKNLRVPKKEVIIYNHYGFALAGYETQPILVAVGGVGSD